MTVLGFQSKMTCNAILKCLDCLAQTCLWSTKGTGKCSHVEMDDKKWLWPGPDALQCPADETKDEECSPYQLGTAAAIGAAVATSALLVIHFVRKWFERKRVRENTPQPIPLVARSQAVAEVVCLAGQIPAPIAGAAAIPSASATEEETEAEREMVLFKV